MVARSVDGLLNARLCGGLGLGVLDPLLERGGQARVGAHGFFEGLAQDGLGVGIGGLLGQIVQGFLGFGLAEAALELVHQFFDGGGAQFLGTAFGDFFQQGGEQRHGRAGQGGDGGEIQHGDHS